MKNYLVGLLFFFFAVSCNTKKEEEISLPATAVKHLDISSKVIGENNKGEYVVSTDDSITKYLESRLRECFGLSDSISFSKFKIIKTTTQGESAKDSFLFLTNTSDELASIALFVDLKGDKFYFRINEGTKTVSSEVIMCKKENAEVDCKPLVLIHGGKERMICDSSGNCEKTGGKVWW